MAEKPTISLKLHIDTQANRVLFAEVKKDFVDFLSHMLSLPLATANTLLRKQGMVGSISNLYSSIQRLDLCYMQQETKDTILNPRLFHANNSFSYVPQFFPKNFFSLNEFYKCSVCGYVITDVLISCPKHNSPAYFPMKKVIYEDAPYTNASLNNSDGGIVTYIVMDNLELIPMSGISIIKNLLDELDMKNFALLQENVVKLGMDEAMKLLKSSMQSQTVLTDVFLKT